MLYLSFGAGLWALLDVISPLMQTPSYLSIWANLMVVMGAILVFHNEWKRTRS